MTANLYLLVITKRKTEDTISWKVPQVVKQKINTEDSKPSEVMLKNELFS